MDEIRARSGTDPSVIRIRQGMLSVCWQEVVLRRSDDLSRIERSVGTGALRSVEAEADHAARQPSRGDRQTGNPDDVFEARTK